MPRAYTTDEVRRMFVQNIKNRVNYWADSKGNTEKEKLSGLAFSILVMLDGGSDLPQFHVVAAPHPDDKNYDIENGDNYFENVEDGEGIEGCLHDLFARMD
jgi:hypothetical protein